MEYSFSYDSTWKDLMDGYTTTYWQQTPQTKTVSYGDIATTTGLPTSYDGWSYAWEAGRQLSGMSKAGTSLSFKYDDNGYRTQKTYNGVTTSYYLDGDKVIMETDGTDEIYYSYDPNGNLVGMNLNGTDYYYIRNAQGDIQGLYDSTGKKVISYTYDAWGKLVSIKDANNVDITNDKTSVGYKNPYRYRGYRYDSETRLYYLNSRYYNPEWGRFINPDNNLGNVGELTSHNIFAYCRNNPVNFSDPNGHELIGALIGAGLGGMLGYLIAKYYHLKGWKYWACISGFAVGGAVVGWFAGPVVAKLAQQVLASIGAGLTWFGQLTFTSWLDAEHYLWRIYGGVHTKYFNTSLGRRFIDVFANGIAHESKVGYVTLTDDIMLQIQKDAELIQRGVIQGSVWHFYGSEVTGKIGASAQVFAELTTHGIKYFIGK